MAPSLLPMFGANYGAVSTALSTMNHLRSADQRQSQFADGLATTAPKIVAASAAEGGIKMYSNEFFYACALGGMISCGGTHTMVTPLDVVKCNMQTNPAKYTGIGAGFSTVVKEQGAAGLFRGWAPTLLGYSAQGACKFGLYEFFKK